MRVGEWAGETAFLIAGGPSLREVDLTPLRGRKVIAINDSYLRVPHAPLLYFCDRRWFEWHQDRPAFRAFEGTKVTLDKEILKRNPEITGVENTGTEGLDRRPWGVRTGRNSGYQAINVAVHLGAKRIVLLGYDMKVAEGGRTHWHDGHPVKARVSIYRTTMLPCFDTLVGPLTELGVEVLNATSGSALTVFPTVRLEETLADRP